MATIEAEVGSGGPRGSCVHRGGRPVLHSHHYSAVLQRTLLEIDKVDARSILERAAEAATYRHLPALPGWPSRGAPESRLRVLEEVFRRGGLGALNLAAVSREGGEAVLEDSLLAFAWRERFGASQSPVCLAAAGFLAGGLAAAFGLRFRVRERECAASGAAACRFEVVAVEQAPAPDPAPTRTSQASSLLPAPIGAAGEPPIGAAAVLAALQGRAVESGSILGGRTSTLWADFYSAVSFELEQEIPRSMGSKFANLASLVLTEAGHLTAYHALGGLLHSSEWRLGVAPLLSSREDWIHALVAVINTLGWGQWRVEHIVPRERLVVRVFGSYEAEGHLALFGPAPSPRCYLARGVSAGLMNLVYVDDPTRLPAPSDSHYNRLFRSPLSFRAIETRCRAVDEAAFCEFIANPLSPGPGLLSLLR